jgi:hypothetical protein
LSEYTSARWAFWKAFVELVYRGATDELSQSEQRKAKAVHQARESGMSMEEIISAGQSEILSRAARNRKKYSEPQRTLRWRVSRSLAEAIQWSDKSSPDAEEALQTRLVRVGDLRTSDDLWEFLNSEYADMPDAELRHRTQRFLGKKRKT